MLEHGDDEDFLKLHICNMFWRYFKVLVSPQVEVFNLKMHCSG